MARRREESDGRLVAYFYVHLNNYLRRHAHVCLAGILQPLPSHVHLNITNNSPPLRVGHHWTRGGVSYIPLMAT